MVQIRKSSATTATVYVHFIIFVIVAVFNFTVLNNTLPIRLGYGVCLVVLSLIALLLSVTSQDPDEAVLRSLLMTLSALWSAVGTFHIVESIVNYGVTDSEALFSGYLTFLIISLFFIFGGLHHKHRVTSIIALGMFLSCIFEIASLWRPLRRSAGAYYLLLAAVTFYLTSSRLVKRFRERNSDQKGFTHEVKVQSKDYIPAGHAMNALAAMAFAGQATGIYSEIFLAFVWIVIAGVYQLVFGVIAVRRNQMYNAIYFFFHGLFWLTNGFNLGVEFSTGQRIPFLTAGTIIHFIIFAVIAGISLTKELFQCLQNLVVCILCVAILVDTRSVAFVSVMGWILFIFALYSLAAHISRVQNTSWKLPLGARLLSVKQLSDAIINSSNFLQKRANRHKIASSGRGNSIFSIDFTLGYSKYGSFDLAGFAVNAVAAIAIVWTPQGLWILPWSVVFGGLSSMIIGSFCFARGLSFESCAFFTFGALWMIWGPARGLGTLDLDNSAAIITGCVGFLAVGLLLLGLSSTINKAWSVVMFFFNLIVVGILLNAVKANGAWVYEVVITVLFVIVCMYCFLAFSLKIIWGREVLPLGRPFLQVSYLHSQGSQAFWADGRTASGVKAIADIMNRGGICGIPTDVVYVLVAALKFPAAIERAYNTKEFAEDRPMSMWISKVEQIEEGRELFGEMVWGLMNEIWPSTVSLVVPKGDWYTNLGVGESGKYVGRPDSIAVRMPDNTVTSHLVDQTGPIATSSANPTGEADTTHHLQVLAKLGLENVDGILCSGPSPENMASTVVDCRNLNDGRISFFRIGVVPRSHVEAIVARVKAYHDGSILPVISKSPIAAQSHDNLAFEDDEYNNDGDNGSSANAVREKGSTTARSRNQTISSRSSVNTSFASTVPAEIANLFRVHPEDSDNGSIEPFENFKNRVSTLSAGHTNKVYESLVPINDEQLTSRPVNGLASPDSSNPYEPMQVITVGPVQDIVSARTMIGGHNSENKQPEFKINPIFEDPDTRTKM